MATDYVKKVQEKLFRGGVQDEPQPSQERGEPGLTINIPKPPPTPAPPPKLAKQSEGSPKNADDDPLSYRERLAKELGEKYNGAERYRLLQDGKRERHWKRWGPYLSDRQWVSSHYSLGRLLGADLASRRLSAKTIPPMATPGVISLTHMRVLARTGGAKMVSPASPTVTSASVLVSPSGMERTPFSRNAFSV